MVRDWVSGAFSASWLLSWLGDSQCCSFLYRVFYLSFCGSAFVKEQKFLCSGSGGSSQLASTQ